jgi:hypothetical protein
VTYRKEDYYEGNKPFAFGHATSEEAAEAQAMTLARKDWTMRLLADKLVELDIVDTVSDETVRRVLKKTRSSRG